MPPISRSERYRRIVTVMLDEGFGTLVDQLGMRAPWISSLRGDRAKGADANLTPEQRLRRTMERLGPTFAKIGQMLSVRPDLIPASFAEELAKLQDTMEPFPFEQVRQEVESSFGQTLEELFAEFDEVPAAAASIGQVHMAVLLDGTPVAVKVQRPDIHEVIEADLDILRTQARRVQGRTDLGRRYDLVGLVDEFSRAIREECDYINEAENCDRLGATFADDPDVHFPNRLLGPHDLHGAHRGAHRGHPVQPARRTRSPDGRSPGRGPQGHRLLLRADLHARLLPRRSAPRATSSRCPTAASRSPISAAAASSRSTRAARSQTSSSPSSSRTASSRPTSCWRSAAVRPTSTSSRSGAT